MSSDGDNFLMGAIAKDDNATGALRSGKFALKGVENPKLAFSFLGLPGIDNTLSLLVSREGQTEEEVLYIPFKTLEGEMGWRTCIADLAKYRDEALSVLQSSPFLHLNP